MQTMQITLQVKIDLEVRMEKTNSMDDDRYVLINLSNKMLQINSEMPGFTNIHNRWLNSGNPVPFKETECGIAYWDNFTWHYLDETVQRAYADLIADRELLSE